MLPGRGKITVPAVGERDGEGGFERALGFDVEADLREDFAGNGGDGEVADADGLDDQRHFGGIIFHIQRFLRVDLKGAFRLFVVELCEDASRAVDLGTGGTPHAYFDLRLLNAE